MGPKWKMPTKKQIEAAAKKERDLFYARLKKTPEEFAYKYSGVLELYYETGFEGCSAVILHDDRGNHEGPKWDNPNETMIYRSLEWSHFFARRDPAYLVVYDPDGRAIFSGHVTNDCRNRTDGMHQRISFIPAQVPMEKWLLWTSKEYRAVVWTDVPCLAEDKKYQEEKAESMRKYEEAKKKKEQEETNGSK